MRSEWFYRNNEIAKDFILERGGILWERGGILKCLSDVVLWVKVCFFSSLFIDGWPNMGMFTISVQLSQLYLYNVNRKRGNIGQFGIVYLSRPATCDWSQVAGCCSFWFRVTYNLRLVACRKSQVVVRFDVVRLIAQPVAGSYSNRPKKQRLKIKKILIARQVADRRSRYT